MSPSLESAEQDYDNGAFLTVISVEVNELLKGITARYITSEKKSRSKKVPIKHKEKVLIFKILLGQNDRTRYDLKKRLINVPVPIGISSTEIMISIPY